MRYSFHRKASDFYGKVESEHVLILQMQVAWRQTQVEKDLKNKDDILPRETGVPSIKFCKFFKADILPLPQYQTKCFLQTLRGQKKCLSYSSRSICIDALGYE